MLAFASLAAVALLATGTNAAVNSVSGLTTCQPSLLSWDASTSPYYLTIIPGGDASGTVLEDLGTFTTTSYTWNVDLAAGTSITIALKDSTGAVFYSGQTTIVAGSDTSCVGASASGATSGAAAATSGAATSAAAAGTTTAAGTAAASGTAAATSATRAASAAVASGSAAVSSAAAAASTAATGAASSTFALSSVVGLGALALGVFSLA
ncbi:hypothetical protein BDY24DRAFT_396302 [Mrakia frigida]|uniref:uncharacterized protein n=1 Tax=Mrakia frigida TaxID=29902 RepID=UPI003FCC0A3F